MHPEVKSKRAHPDPGLLTIFKNMRQIPGSGIYSTTLVNLLNVLKLVLFCFYIIGSFQKRSIPPPRRKFLLSEGGGRKNVLGCPKGGRGKMY